MKSKRRRRERKIVSFLLFSSTNACLEKGFIERLPAYETFLHRRMRLTLISVFLVHQLIITGIHTVPSRYRAQLLSHYFAYQHDHGQWYLRRGVFARSLPVPYSSLSTVLTRTSPVSCMRNRIRTNPSHWRSRPRFHFISLPYQRSSQHYPRTRPCMNSQRQRQVRKYLQDTLLGRDF